MKKTKQGIGFLPATLFGASALFMTSAGAYALPASLDIHTALAINSFKLTSESGQIYAQISQLPIDFEAYSKVQAGNRRAIRKILKKTKKRINVGSAKIETRRLGKDLHVRSGDCHYTLHLAGSRWTPEGLVSTYKAPKKIPSVCGAHPPLTATDRVALKARLINTPKGVYQLPVLADGTSVSTVLGALAPANGSDAGLFGYTYFIKYADGTSLNWGSAGIMSNKLALGTSRAAQSFLIAESIGQGAAALSQAGIRLGSPSLKAPTLKVAGKKPCDYHMFLDKPSIRHKDGMLTVDFEAPKLSNSCLEGKNPLSVTMTVEPLGINPDGNNKMVVENVDSIKK